MTLMPETQTAAAPPPLGTTCLLAAVSDAIRVRDPAITEDVLFLLGEGNRMDYRLDQRDDGPRLFIGNHAMDIVDRFCTRFGIPHALREGEEIIDDVLPELRAQLTRGNRVFAWVDLSLLRHNTSHTLPGSPHALAIEHEDNEIMSIADHRVPISTFKDNATTYRGRIPLREFDAWAALKHRRHLIDLQSIAGHGLGVDAAQIRAAIERAAHDYLHGGIDYPSAIAILRRFNEDLPRYHAQYGGKAYPIFYGMLAASIRYYGILWSRSLLADSIDRYADAERNADLPPLAVNMRELINQWKSVMFLILKVMRADDEKPVVAQICEKIPPMLEQEQALYERLLASLR